MLVFLKSDHKLKETAPKSYYNEYTNHFDMSLDSRFNCASFKTVRVIVIDFFAFKYSSALLSSSLFSKRFRFFSYLISILQFVEHHCVQTPGLTFSLSHSLRQMSKLLIKSEFNKYKILFFLIFLIDQVCIFVNMHWSLIICYLVTFLILSYHRDCKENILNFCLLFSLPKTCTYIPLHIVLQIFTCDMYCM